MANLYVLTEKALEELKKEETINKNIDKCYKTGGESVLDEAHLDLLRYCYVPDELCDKMIEALKNEGDFGSAKVLYEYLKISPLLASNEHLWAYLTHGPLLPYVQTRWSVDESESKMSHILDHWFVNEQSRLMRNALASLWWSVEISQLNSSDEDDPYRLTKILFENYTLRVVVLTQILRSRTVLRGILEWFAKNGTERMEVRGSFIAKYLNQLASIKQLTILDWKDIVSLIDEVKDVILSIQRKEDYQNLSVSDIIYNIREKNIAAQQ